jgi:hypothetical protein
VASPGFIEVSYLDIGALWNCLMLASSSDDLLTITGKSVFYCLGFSLLNLGGDIGGIPSEPMTLYTSSFGLSGSSSFLVSSRIALRRFLNDR